MTFWCIVFTICLLSACGGRQAATEDKPSDTTAEQTDTAGKASKTDVIDESDEKNADTADNQRAAEAFTEKTADNESDEQNAGRDTDYVQIFVNSMTVKEKAAQLFIVTPETLAGEAVVTEAGEALKAALNYYPVGGLVYFSVNLESPEQVTEMLSGAQLYSIDRIGLPLFTAVDEEGGTVSRIGNNRAFGVWPIEDMADVTDAARAYEIGAEIGAYLSALGFNLDFAPVADVLSNPDSTMMANRAFGADSDTVSELSLQMLAGLEENWVIGCLKHFPGHGSASGDTHEGYAYTRYTLDEMLANDMVPFMAGIEYGVSFIMVGHISAPNITDGDTPCSMSDIVMTDILRNRLGYDGIIITDALNVAAIRDNYSSAQAAVMAFTAGADMLLMPADFEEAYSGILTAVADGTITEKRLDESVYRILSLKLSMI